jgi:hypothetical protein
MYLEHKPKVYIQSFLRTASIYVTRTLKSGDLHVKIPKVNLKHYDKGITASRKLWLVIVIQSNISYIDSEDKPQLYLLPFRYAAIKTGDLHVTKVQN